MTGVIDIERPVGNAPLGREGAAVSARDHCTNEATRPMLLPTGRVAHPRHLTMTHHEDRAPVAQQEGENPLREYLCAGMFVLGIPALKWLTLWTAGVQW